LYMNSAQRIYMDHAAATPVRDEVWAAMHAVEHLYGNPGSQHQHGVAARDAYEHARRDIAKVLAVKSQDIIFAGSATEANNLALLGLLRACCVANPHVRPHIVTTAIEHSSVLEVLSSAEVLRTADVSYVMPNKHGVVRVEDLEKSLRPETVLVSVGWANGEVGTVQPMRALVQAIKKYNSRIIVHTDAGQAMFAHSPQPQGIGVDMMTLSSGKLYGPRGVAVLYKPLNLAIQPIMYGGHQESGVRPGTEDVVPAVGFAKALQLLEANRADEYLRLSGLKNLFLQLITVALPAAVHNGASKNTLPHIVNISVPHIDSEYVMLALDHAGVSISTKSVCLESTGEPVSHVVAAVVAEDRSQHWRASTTLRFSFGRATTEADVRYAVLRLAEIVKKHVI
jgi:cysteine desulfurase